MSSSGVNLEDYFIPLEEIKLATENFSPERFIGGGGFGNVYIGELFERRQNCKAAIKRLAPNSYQGQFRNEIDMISKFHHENIIPFIGYCDEGNEMIIVNEYALNGSLDNHLENANKISRITWRQRLEICLGVARGLKYLHSGLGEHTRVIHRDLKSGNILLDENFVAKICDFGLSKWGPKDQPITQLNTMVAGTNFYMDPTYYESHILRKESDIYSLGVVLFEMLSGMPVYRERSIKGGIPAFLMNLVRRYQNQEYNLLDPYIRRDDISVLSFRKFTNIAYKCISLNVQERPTVDTVIAMIEQALDIQVFPESESVAFIRDMTTDDFLDIHPSKLIFPFQLNMQSTCSLQLTSNIDQRIAFKIYTTRPKKYIVLIDRGIVLPRSVRNVTATMKAVKVAPSEGQRKDKFKVLAVIVPNDVTDADITTSMFDKAENKIVKEFMLEVGFLPVNPLSQVLEESIEDSSLRGYSWPRVLRIFCCLIPS